MPNNCLSVLYKRIIQVENKNVGLKVWGGGTNIPLPPPPIKKGGGHVLPTPGNGKIQQHLFTWFDVTTLNILIIKAGFTYELVGLMVCSPVTPRLEDPHHRGANIRNEGSSYYISRGTFLKNKLYYPRNNKCNGVRDRAQGPLKAYIRP